MWVVLNSRSTSWNPVERLIFPAPQPSYDLSSYPQELLLIPRDDGEKVPCTFLPFRHARFLIMYFHANAEDLGVCYPFCKIMRDLFQVHVLTVEYPGYGVCAGKTDEAGIMANAEAAMRFVTEDLHWPCDGIKLFGRSLGTGPAVALAAKYNVAGLVLVSPFTSIRSLFRAQVGSLADMVEDRFQNAESIRKVTSPTLIIHGQKDTLIPIDHGKVLYDTLRSRKMMVCPATMGHNTSLLKNIGTLVLPMTQFFSLPDYTFEDIEVPAWAYPVASSVFAVRPAIGGCCATERMKEEDGEAADTSTATTSLRASTGRPTRVASGDEVPVPQLEGLGSGARSLLAPRARAGQSRPIQVPRLKAADAAPPEDTREDSSSEPSECCSALKPRFSPRLEVAGATGGLAPAHLSLGQPAAAGTSAGAAGGLTTLASMKASKNYNFGLVPSLKLSQIGGAEKPVAPLSARTAPRPSHFREEVLDAIDDRRAWTGNDVARVPWSARGAAAGGATSAAGGNATQWRLARARAAEEAARVADRCVAERGALDGERGAGTQGAGAEGGGVGGGIVGVSVEVRAVTGRYTL